MRAAAHMQRGAPQQRLSRGCTGRGQRRECGVQAGGGSGGGAEAADRGEEEAGGVLDAGEEHIHALALVALGSGGPPHLALLAVHDLVATRKGIVRPRVEDLLAHLVAARLRLRVRAESIEAESTWS